MNRKQAGLTLVEVIIASAILSAVVLMAMSVLFSTSRTAASGQVMAQLEQRGNRILGFCRDQMSTASFKHQTFTNLGIVTSPNSYNSAIAFQVCGPAVVGPTGAATLQFGYPDPRVPNQTFNANLACFLRFEADTVYQESSGSPAATQAANWTSPGLPAFSPLTTVVLNQDVNGNGSQYDTFVCGRIMKYVVDETTNTVIGRERLDDQVLLRVSGTGPGAFSGDVDADGQVDLLFCFASSAGVADTGLTGATGSGILINVWHGSLDDTGKLFILRNNKSLIHFRQE